MPPPADSPYSALSWSATSMPSIIRLNGAQGSASCFAELSCRLMKTCVVLPFATAKASDRSAHVRFAARVVRDRPRAPSVRDLRIAVDAELSPSPFDDAMETHLIVIAGADKVVKTISAVRRPIAMDLDQHDAFARFEPSAETIRRAAVHLRRIGREQKRRRMAVNSQKRQTCQYNDHDNQFTAEAQRTQRKRRERKRVVFHLLSARPRRSLCLCGARRTVICFGLLTKQSPHTDYF